MPKDMFHTSSLLLLIFQSPKGFLGNSEKGKSKAPKAFAFRALAVANHYDATLFFEKSRFFRAFSKKLYPPEVLINIISEKGGFFNNKNTGLSL